MLTPQEVSGHAFTKAVMGGYNMAMVDEFLDELTDDYTALYKENAALKAKMKVLVEKVEDYRATEDSMRATLLTAQKMADSIVREAEDKREQLLREAQAQAQERINAMRREVFDVQERLRAGQQGLADFIQGVRSVCEKQVALLEQLPQLPVEAAAPAPAVPAAEIEERILGGFQQEPTQAWEVKPVQEAAAAPVQGPPAAQTPAPGREARAEEPEPDYPKGNPFAPEEKAPAMELNEDELKFGKNYNREG